MNYKQLYKKLIQSRKNLLRTGYLEKHHILPKSEGGTDEEINLIYLTPREHYIAHALYYKAYKTSKSAHAFWMMFVTSKKHNDMRYKPKLSRMYEYAKQEKSKYTKGKKQKIKTCIYCGHSAGHSYISRIHNENCIYHPIEITRNKNLEKDKKYKDKASNNKKGKPLNINLIIVTCHHCNKSGTVGSMSRWHFDHCLKNPNLDIKIEKAARFNSSQNPNSVLARQNRIGVHLEKKQCPYCSFQGAGGSMSRWHFDNCKQAPNPIIRQPKLLSTAHKLSIKEGLAKRKLSKINEPNLKNNQILNDTFDNNL